jgi:phage gpG-like protein
VSTGALLTIRIDGYGQAARGLGRLSALDEAALLDGLARRIQVQTRTRIEDDKAAPDGTRWKPNRAGTSTLYRDGQLSRSIDYIVRGSQAIVGSGLIYAAIHQFGGVITPKGEKPLVFTIGNATIFARKVTIPARPYLGVSGENASELERIAAAFIGQALGRTGAGGRA